MSSSHPGPTKLELLALILDYNASHPSNKIGLSHINPEEVALAAHIQAGKQRARANYTPLQILAKQVVDKVEEEFHLNDYSLRRHEDDKMGAAGRKIVELWQLIKRLGGELKDSGGGESSKGRTNGHRHAHVKTSPERHATPRDHYGPKERGLKPWLPKESQPSPQTQPHWKPQKTSEHIAHEATLRKRAEEDKRNAELEASVAKLRAERDAREEAEARIRELEHTPTRAEAVARKKREQVLSEADATKHKPLEAMHGDENGRSPYQSHAGPSHQKSTENLGHRLRVPEQSRHTIRTPSPQRHHGEGHPTLEHRGRSPGPGQTHNIHNVDSHGLSRKRSNQNLAQGTHHSHGHHIPHPTRAEEGHTDPPSRPRTPVQIPRIPTRPPQKTRSMEDIKAQERARHKKAQLQPTPRHRGETPEEREKRKKMEKYCEKAQEEAADRIRVQVRKGETPDFNTEEKLFEARVNGLQVASEVRRQSWDATTTRKPR